MPTPHLRVRCARGQTGWLFARYQARLKAASVLDFADMVPLLYTLLEADVGGARCEFNRQYRAALVDEFQASSPPRPRRPAILPPRLPSPRSLPSPARHEASDGAAADRITRARLQDCNAAQLRVLAQLTTPCVTVVGDDDQAIYGFRGAGGGGCFEAFRRARQPAVVALALNFRSSSAIVGAARPGRSPAPDRLTQDPIIVPCG